MSIKSELTAGTLFQENSAWPYLSWEAASVRPWAIRNGGLEFLMMTSWRLELIDNQEEIG